jgi:hypothetical protein
MKSIACQTDNSFQVQFRSYVEEIDRLDEFQKRLSTCLSRRHKSKKKISRCKRIRRKNFLVNRNNYRGSLQQSKYGNKKKSGLPPQRYIGLEVYSLNCLFFKYRLKSSVFIVIYGVVDCGK